MTADDLRAWQARMKFTRPVAAAALATPVGTYDRLIQGRNPISPQVERLCWYVETYGPREDHS